MTDRSQQPKTTNELPGAETILLQQLVFGVPDGETSIADGSPIRLEKLLDRLKMLSLVDDQGELTRLAHDIAPFLSLSRYISVRVALALVASRWYGTTAATIIAVAIISAKHPFFIYPNDSLAAAFAAHQFFESEGSGSDLSTLLAAFLALERVFNTKGEEPAYKFSLKHCLNFGTFLQARKQIESLREKARELGWSLEENECTEAELTATFFWGYLDRLLRWDEVTGRWQPVHRFLTQIQPDSLHHPGRGGDAELVLCAGLILTDGDVTGRTRGTTFNAITPEGLRELVGDHVAFVIESHPCGDGEPEEAIEAWYWGDQILVTRICPMPEGSPLEVLRQLHLRSAGELPLYEPTNGSHSNFTWDDLARRTSVPNLKALVADAWLDYPDELTFEDEQVGIRYEEDGTIVLTLTYEQAGALLPGFREETLPRAWSGRPITFAVDNGEGGTPLTCPIDELDQLRGLFASE